MKTIIFIFLISIISGCNSSNSNVATQGLKVHLEDVLVTLDPENHLIYAKIANEENLPVVDFSEYNPNGEASFYSSISKSEDGEGVVLDCSNGETKHQLLIKKSYIFSLCAPTLFGGELKTATPKEVEEVNNMKPVKIYTDTVNMIEHAFE